MNFTTKRLALPVAIAGLIMSGCASVQDSSQVAGVDPSVLAEKESEISSLSSQVSSLEAQLADAKTMTVPAATADGELLPPNAKPGECYARVFIPPVYRTESEQVLKSEASESLKVIPAQYEWVEEQVLVKAASERLEVVPATYGWEEETILVKPAEKKIVAVPAQYKTETETVLDKPEHTVWKKGSGPIEKIDEATGEIMCLVTVPATYKTITRQVLVSPATTTEIEIPAEYKTIKREVMKTPPQTRTVTIPAEYKTERVLKMVEPAKTMATPIPATYGTVTRQVLVKDGFMEWRPVLCETNMSNSIILDLQRALDKEGYNPGPIDGVIGWQTNAAITKYQRDNGLATGGLTLKTLDSLGVKF